MLTVNGLRLEPEPPLRTIVVSLIVHSGLTTCFATTTSTWFVGFSDPLAFTAATFVNVAGASVIVCSHVYVADSPGAIGLLLGPFAFSHLLSFSASSVIGVSPVSVTVIRYSIVAGTVFAVSFSAV